MLLQPMRLMIIRVIRSSRWVVCAGLIIVLFSYSSMVNSQEVSQSVDASIDESAQPSFQLNELRVLGNSVLSALKISQVLTPYLGPEKNIKDVEAARTAIENEYHAQGYGTVFVDIPEQTIGDDGVVRLRVTESRLQRAEITGARYFSNRQIRAAIPQAAENTVPNLPQLQAQINAVNGVTADRSVVPALKAGTEPATVALGLKVQDELPFHGSFELNNQYTSDTKPLRSALGLSYDNAFGRQDSFSLQYQTAPQDNKQVSVYAASYMAHVNEGDNTDRVMVTAINSSSKVATIGNINVAGKGKTFGLQWLHTLQNTSSVTSAFNLGFDYKDSAQSVRLSATDALDTPLSYSTLQAGYNWIHRQEKSTWALENSLTIGIPSLGVSRVEFADKCYGCKPNFSVLRSQVSYIHGLPWNLTGSWQVSGQYSVEPLISNEQKLIGGAHTVRGYLEAEELGDIGINSSFELRAKDYQVLKTVQLAPYIFFDAGYVSFQEPLPGQKRSEGLQSAGLGFEIKAHDYLTGTLVLADPMTTTNKTKRGDTRVEFLLRTTW